MFDDIDISFREMNPPPKVISYGFFADMHSSGLGVRGRVAKLVRAGSSRSTSSYYTLQPTLNYANLPTNTAEKAAKELQAKSIATSQEVVIAGLKRMYPAGLPGHGKRR